MNKKILFSAILLAIPLPLIASRLDLGLQFLSWNSTYSQPFNGYEVLTPASFEFNLDKNLDFYARTEFANGGYTDSLNGTTETLNLANISDTVVGGEFTFKSFSIPSVFNLSFNLPTGDSTWENKQIASNIPTEFIASRYWSRGFGISAFYGLSFPAGNDAALGVSGGYLYSGSFSTIFGLDTTSQLKLGDSVFVSVDYLQAYQTGQSGIIRLSSYYFLPTWQNGSEIFQLGPAFNASYVWNNPKAFSFELGGQVYFPAQRQLVGGGTLFPEAHNSFGPRFYFNGGYAFGDFILGARAKYVMPNDYDPSDTTFYDGGGFLVGVRPSYYMKLDEGSGLRLSASYDNIQALNAGVLSDGSRANVAYNFWTLGTNYELRL